MADLDIKDLPSSKTSGWSRERLDKAIPIPVPEVSDTDLATGDEQSDDGEDDEILVIPGESPQEPQSSLAQRLPNSERFKYPNHSCGKLFFSHKGKDYVGSAFVVAKLNILMTAGHCVCEAGFYGNEGGRYSDFVFAPYYPYPAYTFRPRRTIIPKEWLLMGRFKSDYAFLILEYPILDGINALGAKFNLGLKRSWRAIGFPAEAPYPGDAMYSTSGDSHLVPYRGSPIGMKNNDMTGGCSGGPWLDSADPHYANGLNSHSRSDWPQVMYSPFFNREVYDHLQAAKYL